MVITSAVTTLEKDKAVKTALDAQKIASGRKLTPDTKYGRSTKFNTRKKFNRRRKSVRILMLDLKYARGNPELDEGARRHCVCVLIGGRRRAVLYSIKIAIDTKNGHISKKIDQTKNCMTSALLDDIIVITCSTKQEHLIESERVSRKLGDVGFRPSWEETKK